MFSMRQVVVNIILFRKASKLNIVDRALVLRLVDKSYITYICTGTKEYII